MPIVEEGHRRTGLQKAFLLAIVVAAGLSFVQVTLNVNLIIVNGRNGVGDDWWATVPLHLTYNGTVPSKLPKDDRNRTVPSFFSIQQSSLLDSQGQRIETNSFNLSKTPNPEGQGGLKKLLLSVPFYVYEDLVWKGARWDGKPIHNLIENSNPKHLDDYWFMRNALRHPMRTKNASEAILFVIPSLHNLFDARAVHKKSNLCYKGLCNKKLMLSAAETVMASPYFQEHSQAHLAVASHFAHHKPWWMNGVPELYQIVLNRSNNIHFEDYKTNDADRWSYPKLHVGRSCPLKDVKTFDLVMVATMKPDDVRFQDRERICSWLLKYRRNSTDGGDGGLFRMEQCGFGAMCPALSNAKLGFHVRGDTLSSNRLLDTLLSGTVPIFTLPKQYEVLPQWIDWKRISYFMNMEQLDESSFIDELTAIVNDTETYQCKLDLVLANRHLFDWTRLYPFDTYMYMLHATLHPETRRNPATIWSAEVANSSILLLPPAPP